jgi:hypothetical protein
MEYPPQWECFPADQFSTAQPRAAGELGMELLMQVRPNGRMLDHFRVTLGGSRILDVNIKLAELLQIRSARTWRLKLQDWPRDVAINRNMTTSPWREVETLIAAREAKVVAVGEDDEETQLEPDVVIGEMKEAGVAAAIRYAALIGGDQRMQLALQGLPASVDHLMGRPAFRG